MFFHSVERWRHAVESAARQVFGQSADDWLRRPNAELAGKAPSDLLSDRAGAQMVMTVLRGLPVQRAH